MYKGNYFELLKDLKIYGFNIIFDKTPFEMLNVIYDKNSKEVLTFFSTLCILIIILITYGFYNKNSLCLVIGISIFVNLPFLLIEKGIEIDKLQNKYRFYNSIFGLKFNTKKWYLLPNTQYISLYKAKKTREAPMGVNYNYSYFYIYEINLFDENNQHYMLFQIDFNYLSHALFCSKQIANYLNIPIVDATTHEHKWINNV